MMMELGYVFGTWGDIGSLERPWVAGTGIRDWGRHCHGVSFDFRLFRPGQ